MLPFLFRSTIRHLFKDVHAALFSVSGLTVGLTVSILTFLWLDFELNFDRYHPDNKLVFAVLTNTSFEGEIETSDEAPDELLEYLKTNVPEVQSATRVDGTQALLSYATKSVHRYGAYVDSEYFDVFNTSILSGNSSKLLTDLHSIVISDVMAQLLFPNDEALGKIISLDSKSDFEVTGIYKALPANSTHHHIHYFLPFNARQRDSNDWKSIYIKLTESAPRSAVEARIDSKLSQLFEDESTTSLLFALTDWRLHWSFENGKVSGGRIVYVIVFSITALFILVMACVNYMTLSTANAAKRAREIGVRKISGATRVTLIYQFLLESMRLTSIAAILSIVLAYILLPSFDSLMEVDLRFSIFDPMLALAVVAISVCTGLVAGIYPALLLSSLKPATILKGNLYSAVTGAAVRRLLVAFQFTLSVILIFCALVMHHQIDFMLHKDLGFDKNNVIIVDSNIRNLSLKSFRDQLISNEAILSVGVSDSSPIEINGAGEVIKSDEVGHLPLAFNGASCDEGYLPTLGLNFIQGRNFSASDPSDSLNFIITQKAAELLGFDDPIGQTIQYPMYHDQEGKIIGVIQDFHNDDVHNTANPVIFSFFNEHHAARIFIRYQEQQLDKALIHLKKVYKQFDPGVPLQYGFLDRDFENQFYQERVFRKFTICFTVIGILIASFGLFGLATYNAQRRTKEMAVRKISGATVLQVMTLLYLDFRKPILTSFLVAFPVAYFAMSSFLASYPSRINISIVDFAQTGLITVGVIILTVSIQSYQAAVKNPVDFLRG